MSLNLKIVPSVSLVACTIRVLSVCLSFYLDATYSQCYLFRFLIRKAHPLMFQFVLSFFFDSTKPSCKILTISYLCVIIDWFTFFKKDGSWAKMWASSARPSLRLLKFSPLKGFRYHLFNTFGLFSSVLWIPYLIVTNLTCHPILFYLS